MRDVVSALPDKMLRLSRALPWPLKLLMWTSLRRVFQARGRATGELTRICFGSVTIAAPLDHPAVYWRYAPPYNCNYLAVAKRTLQARRGLIIDVGANIGDGVALLRGAEVDAPILAIEGDETWFRVLRFNTNSFSAVALEQVFLGTGEQDNLFVPHVNVKTGSSKLVKGDSGVVTTSLDTLLLHHKEYPVVLLKTDTDGFDAKVLFGAKSLLTEQKPVVFAEVDEGLLRDQGNSSQELVEYLSACGYTAVAVWDNYGNWLTSRRLSEGLSDLIARYPGGPETPYLDVAVFSEADSVILDSLKGDESNKD
jgi:FkbM family methyltransferase